MTAIIRDFRIEDHAEAFRLWESTGEVRDNLAGRAFWHGIGGDERVSLATFSLATGGAG